MMKLQGIYEKIVVNRYLCAVLRSKGLKNKEVADIVGIHENTVKTHNKRWKDSRNTHPEAYLKMLIKDLTDILEWRSETVPEPEPEQIETGETKISKKEREERKEDYLRVNPKVEPREELYTEEILEKKGKKELKHICEAIGINAVGTKATLRERILELVKDE